MITNPMEQNINIGTWEESHLMTMLCAQNFVPTISLGQKWWRPVLKIELAQSQWEGVTCTQGP